MFDSIVLDVVIGLIFIYLLYSLFVTILSELIATMLGLRARNLKEAIDRMLNDEKPEKYGQRLLDSLKLRRNPNNPVVNTFYNNAEIKYLGSSGLFKHPSTFKAGNFSKVVMKMLLGNSLISKESIEGKLKAGNFSSGNNSNENLEIKIDPETLDYLNGLWKDSQGDIEKFKLLLEDWFNNTMDHTREWYKRKIRAITFVLGFFVAWFFCADTFVIVNNIATDKEARTHLVSMANSYVQNNKIIVDTTKIKDSAELEYYIRRVDSLLEIKNQLQTDITKAHNILGIGGWPSNKITVTFDSVSKNIIYSPTIDARCLSEEDSNISNGIISLNLCEKIAYFLKLLYYHFFGILITAIAISLGAPFWFDLLNKIMSLRTSTKESTKDTTSDNNNVSPINRVG